MLLMKYNDGSNVYACEITTTTDVTDNDVKIKVDNECRVNIKYMHFHEVGIYNL